MISLRRGIPKSWKWFSTKVEITRIHSYLSGRLPVFSFADAFQFPLKNTSTCFFTIHLLKSILVLACDVNISRFSLPHVFHCEFFSWLENWNTNFKKRKMKAKLLTNIFICYINILHQLFFYIISLFLIYNNLQMHLFFFFNFILIV